MTDNLPDLLKSLYDIRTQKRALDKTEKAILADLKPLVDPKFDALPDAPVVENGPVPPGLLALFKLICY